MYCRKKIQPELWPPQKAVSGFWRSNLTFGIAYFKKYVHNGIISCYGYMSSIGIIGENDAI
jgi:hypothetical protein